MYIMFQEGEVDTLSQLSDDDDFDDDMAPHRIDDDGALHEDAETIVKCYELYGFYVCYRLLFVYAPRKT